MKHDFTRLFISGALLCGISLPAAQAQTLDPAFQATVLKSNPPLGLQTAPQVVKVQPDGKILIGGGFDFTNGTATGKIQRLNTDGTNDTSFNPGGIGANGFIASIVLQPDGKILIGGGFTAYNGTSSFTVARLNANGTLDQTFSPTGLTARQQVATLALQADGKILVGGGISLDPAFVLGGITRLNTDGSLDNSFNIGTGVTSGFVRSLLVQADGKILAGGTFTTFNGQTVGNLVRLTSTGSLDNTFAVGTGTDNIVRTFAQQADGKILVGGTFTTLNGQPAPSLARLLLNGTLDNTFVVATGPKTGTAQGTVLNILVQANGSLVISGNFAQYDGQPRNRVARVSDTGTLDAAFATGTAANGAVTAIAPAGTGQFVAVGNFTQYDGAPKTGLTRLTTTGTNDATFTAATEARGSISQAVPLANGQLLVNGNFTEINGTASTGSVRRLNANGTLDATYTTQPGGTAYAIQPDGSYYLAFITSATQYELRHVLASGAADNNFTALTFTRVLTTGAATLQNVTVQPDGRILVYGNFSTYGGAARNSIARLNSNGTLDNTFTPPASAVQRIIFSVTVQPSGKLVILYEETGPNAATGTFLARLNADGTLDNTYSIGTGAGPGIYFGLLKQPDGKVIITGGFTSFNGQATPYGMVRLGIDGAVDTSFNGLTSAYNLYQVQADGQILATTGLYGTTSLVRLNSNGSRDNSFAPVAIPLAFFIGDDLLSGIVLQPTDNKIVVYGSFRSVAGQLRFGLARLTNPTTTATRAGTAALPLAVYPNPASQRLTVVLPAVAPATQATLLDLTGRTVRRWALPTQREAEASFDLSAVAAGVYVLRIPGTAGTYQQKVVITH